MSRCAALATYQLHILKEKYLVREPIQRIQDRINELGSTFSTLSVFLVHGDTGSSTDESMRSLYNKIMLNNNFEYLVNETSFRLFSNERIIPLFYFDKIDDNGVLWVRNEETGAFIRKDNAVLKYDGTFIHKDSSKIIDVDRIQNYLKQRYYYPTFSAMFSDCVYYWYGLYLPFKEEDFKPCLKMTDLKNYFATLSNYFLHANYIEFTWSNFEFYIKRKFKMHSETVSSRLYFVPLMSDDEYSTNLARYKYAPTDTTNGYIGNVWLNFNNHPEYFNFRLALNSSTPADTDIRVPMGEALTFTVAMEVVLNHHRRPLEQTQEQSQNLPRKTSNNAGSLLGYTTRVNDYKPMFKMTKEEELFYEKNPKSPPIFLGIELELNSVRPDVSSVIKDIADSPFGDHCIMKSDGSIGARGLEIVTVAATLKYHKEMFIKHFFNPPNSFNKRLMSTPSCGIHVHISKKVFTKLSLGKFIAFINSPDNKTFVNAIAGRVPNSYCSELRLANKNSKGVDISAKIAKGIDLQRNNEHMLRNATVNLAKHASTAEVRIFKASKEKHNVLRKLEFCEALVRFCKEYSLQQMTVHDFVSFILKEENKKEYPFLLKWLGIKGYVSYRQVKVKNRKRLYDVYKENLVPIPTNSHFYKNKKFTKGA